MPEKQKRIAENVAAVRYRIAEACRRAGRTADDVELVAVTKYVDAEITRMLPEAGCHDLGESRPQSMWSKADALQIDSIRWHMIGHIQRNKLRRTLPLLHCIHSADSERLLTAMNLEAERIGSRPRVFVEVNVSRDPEKHGFSPTEARQISAQLDSWPHLDVCGLMAMSARTSDASRARSEFAQLRQLRDAMQVDNLLSARITHLSMGMSRDFEVAIEEGATVVRVGSALFDGAIG